MKEIFVADKQKFINEEYPFEDKPQLTDKFRCLHCREVITVGDYKVFRDETGEDFIYCPNAPECNGTIIDWVDVDANL
jgi:hypothetical protein